MAQRAYRPYRLNVDGQEYEIQLGRPGKPHVYAVKENGQQLRVHDGNLLTKIAHALRHDVDQRKAEAKLRQHWVYRALRAAASPFVRFYWWCHLQVSMLRRVR